MPRKASGLPPDERKPGVGVERHPEPAKLLGEALRNVASGLSYRPGFGCGALCRQSVWAGGLSGVGEATGAARPLWVDLWGESARGATLSVLAVL